MTKKLWEIEIRPNDSQTDQDGIRLQSECHTLGVHTVSKIRTGKSYLVEGDLDRENIEQLAIPLLTDSIVEQFEIRQLSPNEAADTPSSNGSNGDHLVNVLFKSGVTDNVANTAKSALIDLGLDVTAVATCRKYWIDSDISESDLGRTATKILSNDAIEQVIQGPLKLNSLALGSPYEFQLITVEIREMDDSALTQLSAKGQLYLSLEEMRTIKQHFLEQDRDPTDVELETVAQTWSEHCSHKTLAGRIHYQDDSHDIHFDNMLKETVFAATVSIRESLGEHDWCVSVFEDNAGVVTFDETHDVCFKAETHNHPSALEPYGGANTGIGGVIRDPLGTGMGAKPICNTDVFCFAPPDIEFNQLPPGVLHPKAIATGVVSGVRDYGNRMGIPTVNGAVYFDERYLGNPLVYCGNVAMIPVGKSQKNMQPGDFIVAVGGRTGRDGIHGATFSSAELTEESETLSGGSVQIGNAITEKMVADIILEARDRELFSSITDCGAGGFSSAVGEMGEHSGAEVWLEKAPLKYEGLSYTEIWISEAQERMVLAVPPEKWKAFNELCASEGVEACVLGKFTDTHRLVLKYDGHQVADISMEFLHDGRPPVIREAVYKPAETVPVNLPEKDNYNSDLLSILGSLNVCSKEWIIRQYDHEVQAGSVVKPLVGVNEDGPSDAAVVRPNLTLSRGLVISCGMNPQYGDFDTYWMAASAIDEAIRNCISVGADPEKIAILDNFCWGNTDRPETLGSLVRAALACKDFAIDYGTPFISGKDSLNNEFAYMNEDNEKVNVAIPASLLISALGQMDDVTKAVTMDAKAPGNLVYLLGSTQDELGGSHFCLVNDLAGGQVPKLDSAAAMALYRRYHVAVQEGLVRSCHDLSEGGLAVSAAEMAFAGGFGLDLDISVLAESSEINEDTVLLFSESNSRFLIEISLENQSRLEELFANLPCSFLGTVTEERQLKIVGCTGSAIVDCPLTELKSAWQKPLDWD